MNNRQVSSQRILVIGLVLLASACSAEISTEYDAVQLDGVWVFTYGETPDLSMDALGGGDAAVVDGCLQMGDAVVIWRDEHLGVVEEIIQSVDAGDTVGIRVGGGGLSLDEGSTLDDFPDVVLEHCAPVEIWFAGLETPSFASER